ncbi:MAG: iron ABC transporter permease [Bacteroidaceae bacterium]|nr:iron ABC transporter permease [Bacteroidaceae bacterium]
MKHIIFISVLIVLLFVSNLFLGSVSIPAEAVLQILMGGDVDKESWSYIVIQSRLPQALTALFCGSSLAVSGLMLQTAFSNPLAGPSILGISSGANLGVAIVMLATGGAIVAGGVTFSGFMSVLVGAFIGSMLIMALILFLSTFIRSNLMLLITGIMIGYITSSAISLLNFFATEEGVHSYVIWGMGNFGGVSMKQMPMFASCCIVGLFMSVMLIKPLNALLMGNQYAENLGINIRRTRNLLLLATGLLTAVTTAFCGPIAFFGLAVPHVARMILRTENHNTLLPVTILCGAAAALICNLICVLPGEKGIIPLNAVTPMLGAPVIIYVIMKQRATH